jgi:predicted HD phosphohydrolase
MSRHLLSVLLSLSLLFSQQAALVHELGHSFQVGQSNPSMQSQSIEDKADVPQIHQAVELCKTCFAYAQLAYSVPSHEFALDVAAETFAELIATNVSSPDPRALRISNRGPPTFL